MSTAAKRKTKSKATKRAPAKAKAPRKHAPAPKKAEAPAPPPKPVMAKKELPAVKSYLLAIRLKGEFGTPRPIQNVLDTIRLRRKFNAVLLEKTPSTIGMLRRAKDYVTWGEANQTDIVNLLRERGEFRSGGAVTDEGIREKIGEKSVQDLAAALVGGKVSLGALWQKGLSPVFRLRRPSGGFEGSTKRAYGSRGELGKREAGFSSLLNRMV